MKIIAVTQARLGSSRLPRKVLKTAGHQTLLEIHLRRILKARLVDKLIVATTTQPDDLEIADLAIGIGVEVYRGSESDVLDRFYRAVLPYLPDYVVRLTSDCPLIDPDLIDKVIQYTLDQGLDYCSNALEPNYPDGQDIEVFSFKALQKAWLEAELPSEREHVTPFIWKNSTFHGERLFYADNFHEGEHFGDLRMTVDEPKDLEVIRHLIERLGTDKGWRDYALFLRLSPEIIQLNADIERNEGLAKSLLRDQS